MMSKALLVIDMQEVTVGKIMQKYLTIRQVCWIRLIQQLVIRMQMLLSILEI